MITLRIWVIIFIILAGIIGWFTPNIWEWNWNRKGETVNWQEGFEDDENTKKVKKPKR